MDSKLIFTLENIIHVKSVMQESSQTVNGPVSISKSIYTAWILGLQLKGAQSVHLEQNEIPLFQLIQFTNFNHFFQRSSCMYRIEVCHIKSLDVDVEKCQFTITTNRDKKYTYVSKYTFVYVCQLSKNSVKSLNRVK